MTAEEALETMDERLFYFNDYSKTFSPCIVKIRQDLERLEKLEKAIDILKEVLKNELVLNLGENIVYISKINHNNSIVYIGKEECELLKEVLEND